MQILDIGSILDQQPWLLAPLYVVLWCTMCFIIAQTTGWQRVARAFPADHVPQGTLLRWRTLLFGKFTHYGNSVNVILSSEGIYMVPAKLFRLGHTPILLPWSCVTEIKPTQSLTRLLKVSLLADGKQMTLFVPGASGGDIERLARRKVTPLEGAPDRTQTQSLR